MSSSLAIYLIEEEGLETPLSCRTNKLERNPLLKESLLFSSAREFERNLHRIMNSIRSCYQDKPNDTYLLIISAHGKPQTGTLLEANPEESINLRLYSDFFNDAPRKFVVYVSACWGLYPSVIDALTHKATIIGPIINISGKHNKEMQDRIIGILLTSKECEEYESAFCRLKDELDKKWQKNTDHPHPESVGIVKLDGTWIPPQEVGGLSAPIRGMFNYRIVALQKTDCRYDNPTHVILWDTKKLYWWIPVANIIAVKELTDIDPYEWIGKYITISAKIERDTDSDSGIGKLADVLEASYFQGNSKLRSYKYPNSNVSEKPDKNKAIAPKQMPVSSIRRACKACNWATLTWWQKRDIKGVKMIRGVEGRCFREDCIEHEKNDCNYGD